MNVLHILVLKKSKYVQKAFQFDKDSTMPVIFLICICIRVAVNETHNGYFCLKDMNLDPNDSGLLYYLSKFSEYLIFSF